jgi:hypothetical protein
MLNRISHFLGMNKKDAVLEKRFQQMKKRYGVAAGNDPGNGSYGRAYVNEVGESMPLNTAAEVNQVFLSTYARSVPASTGSDISITIYKS